MNWLSVHGERSVQICANYQAAHCWSSLTTTATLWRLNKFTEPTLMESLKHWNLYLLAMELPMCYFLTMVHNLAYMNSSNLQNLGDSYMTHPHRPTCNRTTKLKMQWRLSRGWSRNVRSQDSLRMLHSWTGETHPLREWAPAQTVLPGLPMQDKTSNVKSPSTSQVPNWRRPDCSARHR